eukprot:CAMPEP_0115018266 /NCGR_PEP_ID=MMETSP0216-20121206/28686_1 /TAXON_ID=223996 /ORGANISM="Protocruzia adherens, Strain Boccale" /LENGTH=243 /DNA_ID=CAMNT_0002389393 /DNA_START=66 /DNA_END=797 /DNA_ORIENTATION=+
MEQQSPKTIVPNVITKKFLGRWTPANHCFCCDSFTLMKGMKIITIIGMIVSAINAVRPVVITAIDGHWFLLLFTIINIVQFVFFWKGYRAAVSFNIDQTKVFMKFMYVFSAILLIQSIIIDAVMREGRPFEFVDVLTLILNIYSIYIIWSFIAKMEVGDFELIKNGPKRDGVDNQMPQIVQGHVVQNPQNNQEITQGQLVLGGQAIPIVESGDDDQDHPVKIPMTTAVVITKGYKSTSVEDGV